MSTEQPSPFQVEIVGPFREDPGVKDAITASALGEGIPDRVRELEAQHSPEQIRQLHGLGAAFIELGNDLGVDLSDNMPTPERFHFFNNEADFHEALRAMDCDIQPGLDALTTPLGIFILTQEDDYHTICLAAHEAVHAMERIRAGIAGDMDEADVLHVTKLSSYAGYRFQHDEQAAIFEGLRELATDLTYLHLRLGGYWDRQPDLPTQTRTPIPMHYSSLDIIGEDLILGAAHQTGTEPLAVLMEVERDIFTGRRTGLKMLTEYLKVVGDAQATQALMKHLMHAPIVTEDPARDYAQLAEQLGLPNTAARISELYQGIRQPVLEWVRPNVTASDAGL